MWRYCFGGAVTQGCMAERVGEPYMLQLQINKQKLYYSMQGETVPVYEKDENGEIIYDEIDGEQVPRLTGDWQTQYQKPVMFYGNINSGNVGEARARAYGLSLNGYEAILCMRKGELPINEKTLIWYQTVPTFLEDVTVNPQSADYQVKRCPPCLDEIVYLLKRLDSDQDA